MFYRRHEKHIDISCQKTHIVVDRQGRINRASHLAVFVTLSQLECARSIPQLCALSEKLRSVIIVYENNIFNASFMQKGEFMEGMRKFFSGVFGGSLEPFDTFLWATGKSKSTIEFSSTKSVHCSRVKTDRSFPASSSARDLWTTAERRTCKRKRPLHYPSYIPIHAHNMFQLCSKHPGGRVWQQG